MRPSRMEPPVPEAASTIPPELLARVAKGDKQAFLELYDRSSPLLFALAARILGDTGEAGALLQEVYLEIWRKGVRYDLGRGTPITWLLNVTRTRALDRLRSRSAQARDRADGQREAGALAAHAAPAAPADREVQALVAKALAEMPAHHRQAVELAYYGGLSVAEIAARLSQQPETIQTWIRRAVTELKTALRPAWASQTRDGTHSV